MLKLTVSGDEFFDEATNTFVTHGDVELELEHSLVSLSKWESTWEKPFLGGDEKTDEETLGYVIAMTLTPNVPPEIFHRLSNDNLLQINEYINRKMSATWFNEETSKPKNREIVTAEVIYNWMISLELPFECENWHLNKLLTLIKVRNHKSSPPKKMSRQEMLADRKRINDERRAKYGTSG